MKDFSRKELISLANNVIAWADKEENNDPFFKEESYIAVTLLESGASVDVRISRFNLLGICSAYELSGINLLGEELGNKLSVLDPRFERIFNNAKTDYESRDHPEGRWILK